MLTLHFCNASVTADRVPEPLSRKATGMLFKIFGRNVFLFHKITFGAANRYYLIC